MSCKEIAVKRRKRDQEKICSFSARLPGDVRGALRNCICAVKCTSDPLSEFRKSISEMIRELRVRSWEEMEELVYCYVVLNSADVHLVIKDAFLGVCSQLE